MPRLFVILFLAALVTGPRLAAAEPLRAEVFDGRSAPGKAPVVLLLHGGGGSGGQLRRTTGFDRWARAAGVVAVYPSAPGRFWHDGRVPGRPGRDDVAALLALVEDLDRRGIADAGRLYVAGHSNGGGMAMRIACARPEALRGIAVVGTKVLTAAPCEHPAAPLPAVFFYGTADELAPHDGRSPSARPRDALLGAALSAADSLALWQRRNGCGSPPATRAIDAAPDGVTVIRHDWPRCAAALRYFEIAGGGHAWPGARARRAVLPRTVPEPQVRDIDAGEEIVRFFFGR